MKKILIAIIAILSVTTSAKASHVLGGEISWRCLPTGQYVFSMTVFRDCTGITWPFNNETIDILGSPLPTNSVQSIVVKPDSNRWRSSRNGDTSPDCTDQYGEKYTCPDEDQGTVQAFWYTSDPITLTGTPPSAGWKFVWQSPCCRPSDIENVQTAGGTMLLRAIMYPGPGGVSVNPCYDSSPQFRALPTTLICRGYEFTYNHTAIDIDLDSLIYSWDRPYDPPKANPTPLPYKPGYSPNSPTPGTNQNINNIPATLDPITGITTLAVYSGFGVKKFVTVAQVDSYREGVLIATVFREIPISLFDCPPLPNGLLNNVPIVNIDGIPTRNVTSDIVAGQSISIPIQAVDNDLTGVGSQLQVLTMVPDGLLFTQSRGENSPCIITTPNVEPCAYLRNQNPFIDQTQSPSVSVLKGLGIIGTEFSWQTDCKHIRTRTGFPGTNEGIYNFVMRVFDDHCPIPALNYPTITVRVKDPIPLTEPIMKGASVELDGRVTFSWAPSIDSTFGFDHYEVRQSRPTNGVPVLFSTVNTNLRRYKQESTVANIPVYELNDINDPASGSNLLRPLGKRQSINYDWFVKMRAFSGCTDTNTSAYSDNVRVMEVTSTPSGVGNNPPRSRVRLNWNRPKPTRPFNRKSYDYFRYESPTHFYVYANDSIRQGPLTNKTFQKGEENPNFWYLIGDTSGTSYEINATTCNDFIGFRVEARDTVVTYKQGSSIRQDSLDTLVFSTFSIIDTMFMETNSEIPTPKFDTIEVLANGQVFLRVDLTNKATTGRYEIFENDTNASNLLASFNALVDSVVVLNGADINIKNIVIRAIDNCDANNKRVSGVYNTFIAGGREGAPCSGQYIVTWPANKPGGFPNGITGYKVYVDSSSRGYELVGAYPASAIEATVSGLKKSTTYKFRVIAVDAEGAVNISAPHTFTTPSLFANNDKVFAPEPRCSYVNNNGSVLVSFLPAVDTSDNFGEYRFRYRVAGTGGAWLNVTGEETLPRESTSFLFNPPGLNAQLREYEFELNTLSGCTGDVPFPTANVINSVFVTATPLPGAIKEGEIMWNPPGPTYASNNFFDLNKDDLNAGYSGNFYKKAVNTNTLTDNDNGAICDGFQEYYVNIVDSLFGAQFQCETRSNLANARYIDSLPPDPLDLNYASFNLQTRGLDLYWSGNLTGDSAFIQAKEGLNSGIQEYSVKGRAIEDDMTLFIPYQAHDARDSSVNVGLQLKDQCGNSVDINTVKFHETMEIEVDWSVCDSINTIEWNPYVGFTSTDTIRYDVYQNITGALGDWVMIGSTTDTTFKTIVTVGDLYYRYHVRAYTNDQPTFVSNSNIDSTFSTFIAEPLYGYVQYATVLPNNNVEIQYYRDTVIDVKGYTLFRGQSKDELKAISFIKEEDINGGTLVTLDKQANVDQASFYYRFVAQNDCDIPVGPTNFGRTIYLTVQSDDEALKNTLSWNRYEGWDSTVAYYNIYRATVGTYPTELLKVVEPNSRYTYNTYVDDIYNELTSGKFCYRIEAVQGPVNDAVVNGYPNDLQPATSSSNVACVLQNPLMYVPNAFVPDGINKIFKPSGTFFDLSRFEMIIYNRWGAQIFMTRDFNKGWDGTVEGEDAGVGSYVYMIRYTDGDGKEHRQKGTVTLIR